MPLTGSVDFAAGTIELRLCSILMHFSDIDSAITLGNTWFLQSFVGKASDRSFLRKCSAMDCCRFL